MVIDKSRVRRHFDRHAHEYERYAVVQAAMAEEVATAALGALRGTMRGRNASGRLDLAAGTGREEYRCEARILEIGCGTGRLTAALARALPEARFVCIDLSANMIAAARQNLAHWQLDPDGNERVTFLEGDAETLVAEGESFSVVASDAGSGLEEPGRRLGFDLIVSNAAFQWFAAPHRTIQACLRLLRPGGALVFSTFGPGTFRQLHASFAEAERLLGLDAVPHGQSFAGEAGWRECFAGADGTFRWSGRVVTETSQDVRAFLHGVKRIGAGNAVVGGHPGVGGRKLLETMERIYTGKFAAPGGGVETDYELGFGIFLRADLA
ncbi:methyltransferase domain-containing protein [Paenibacillus hodogayensis]|uniref:Methyltransferase domain-containing protein n=1 Tax=Paenibacillus hodogayensis TaxID=279208 RepID=A0ABV5W6A7_9BACL